MSMAYEGSVESVFAILVGVGFGYLADRQFETSPWGLLVGLLIGFSAFVLRLVRLGRQLEASATSSEASDPGGEEQEQEQEQEQSQGVSGRRPDADEDAGNSE
jgi:ATP synthase protein I